MVSSSYQRYKDLMALYMKPYWIALVFLFLLLLTSIALQLTAPLILRTFIDTVTQSNTTQTRGLSFYALAFIGVSIMTQVVSVFETRLAEHVAWSATNQFRSDVALHCLRQDLPFYHVYRPGELIERVDGDIGVLANFFSRFVTSMLGHLLYLVGMLAILFSVNWQFGIFLIGFSIGTILLLSSLRRIGQVRYQGYRQAQAELMAFVEERLAATEDIRSSGAIPYSINQLYVLLHALLRKEVLALLLSNSIMWATTAMLITLGTAIVLFLSATSFADGTITIGTVYLIFSYTLQLMQPLSQLSEQMRDFQQAGAAIARIEELLDLKPIIQDGPNELPGRTLSVEFQNVCFGYVADELVLNNVTFCLESGKSLGILGRTGSGKTTIARLLLRLYDPVSGSICVGGTNVREVKLVELRQHIAFVTQDVHIFHASVRDNITVFRTDVSDEDILLALQNLGLWPWYQAMPQGLDTVLAPDGNGLSAGEAQLLALTRVFLMKPHIIVLDEASSRLDPATEYLIDRAISRLVSNRTALIIAHRLGTIQHVDDILILEDGHVREYGERQHLTRNPQSHFSHLLRTESDEALL